MKTALSPLVADLRLESVLVQAWKKTSEYIRSHNWYADTLDLDYQSLQLPSFIRELQKSIDGGPVWTSTPLRFVPAPKAQRWALVQPDQWKSKDRLDEKIRPLAHVALRDQVVATAIMLSLADRVETLLGNVTRSSKPTPSTLSYGHRLFCDVADDGSHRHRWGSKKLYRQYFADYREFLKRPDAVADTINVSDNEEIAIVQTDLSRFYDRVRPGLLHSKLKALCKDKTEETFFAFAETLFQWSWYDKKRADRYARANQIDGFHQIALPQGLVASGFMANIVLLDLDTELRNAFGKPLNTDNRLILCDACHYVDDFRMVFRIEKTLPEEEIKKSLIKWLNELLTKTASGLEVLIKKTEVTVRGREQRFLVQQSKTATRIQHEVSGPFDMLHGTEIIGAIEGFFHTQLRFSTSRSAEDAGRAGLLVGVSDMRDDTAARFAAGRFRRTFRSLRPMLDSVNQPPPNEDDNGKAEEEAQPTLVLSQEQLDERGKLFAATLIEEWVLNPANVRLLRIGLDLFPHPEFLEKVLVLLRPSWQTRGVRKARREIMVYCLSEIFRAGATETGLVTDNDVLPADSDVDAYHAKLLDEAQAIFGRYRKQTMNTGRYPWYLMQQVILYLLARDPSAIDIQRKLSMRGALGRYMALVNYIRGYPVLSLDERAAYLSLVLTAFGHESILQREAEGAISEEFLEHLTLMSPDVATELWKKIPHQSKKSLLPMAYKLGIEFQVRDKPQELLPEVVRRRWNPFHIEENLLQLGMVVAEHLLGPNAHKITPWHIECPKLEWDPHKGQTPILNDRIQIQILSGKNVAEPFFQAPDWCDKDDAARVLTGQILRFALRGRMNFLRPVVHHRRSSTPRYRKPTSHWEQLRYGSYQSRTAFGPDWIPLSSWTENLLLMLLRWPGCGGTPELPSLREIASRIESRLEELQNMRDATPTLIFLDRLAERPEKVTATSWIRPLRIGVVQTITPCLDDYTARRGDPTLTSDPAFRRTQRRHLAAIVDGVGQMLRVRETHIPRISHRRTIDCLVFPELAIHPRDVDMFLLPFVRTYRCMIFAGLVYHAVDHTPGAPIINSAVWMIPEWTSMCGLQVQAIEQGKMNLAQGEEQFTPAPLPFRPAQWKISYVWNSDRRVRPLHLTGAICYDATDLDLAAALRNQTDLFIVCALNKDVGTFDRMVDALHYHMYQGMLIVNNGQFGGTSFYAPLKEPYHRQVLHLHGQPQASIAFLEIDPQKIISRPQGNIADRPCGEWKHPPAGWRPML